MLSSEVLLQAKSIGGIFWLHNAKRREINKCIHHKLRNRITNRSVHWVHNNAPYHYSHWIELWHVNRFISRRNQNYKSVYKLCTKYRKWKKYIYNYILMNVLTTANHIWFCFHYSISTSTIIIVFPNVLVIYITSNNHILYFNSFLCVCKKSSTHTSTQLVVKYANAWHTQ